MNETFPIKFAGYGMRKLRRLTRVIMFHTFCSYCRVMVLTVLAGSFSIRTLAQSNVWLADGTQWLESFSCCAPGLPTCGSTRQDLRVVNGDTLINGHLYKKVFHFAIVMERECYLPPGSCSEDTVFVNDQGQPSFFLRDTLGSMYRLEDGDEDLLYDMDLEVGDVVPQTVMWTTANRVVLSIDSILVQGSYRKQYHTSHHSLVEGVGWNRNGEHGFFLPTYIGYCSYGEFCYSVGDTSFFPVIGTACSIPTSTPTDMVGSILPAPHPNPASEFVHVEVPRDALYVSVVSSTGAEVWRTDDPSAGQLTIPLVGVRNGVYMLEMGTRSTVSSQRFMVARP